MSLLYHTATSETYTLSLTRRSSDLCADGSTVLLEETNSDTPSAMMRTFRTAPARSRPQKPFVRRGRKASGVCSSLRSEEHTSELQSHSDLVCRLLLEKKKIITLSYL